MSNKPQYDLIGDNFAKSKREFFKTEKDPAREFFRKFLTDITGKSVIDVGCGAGDDVVVYEQIPFATVYGVDPSPVMVKKAKAISKWPENIRIGDFESTHLSDASVDFVTGRYSIHYLKNFDKAYKEVARILKPGGLMLLSGDHPVADAVEGEFFIKNDYKYVRIKLYKGKVTTEFPAHNFSDYISEQFLKYFKLLEIEEPTSTDRDFQAGPNGLLYAARKR